MPNDVPNNFQTLLGCQVSTPLDAQTKIVCAYFLPNLFQHHVDHQVPNQRKDLLTLVFVVVLVDPILSVVVEFLNHTLLNSHDKV